MEIIDCIIILGFSISVISEIMTIITLYFQLTIKNLRKFPGELITIQCVAQMFYDLHWFSVLPQIKSWVFKQSAELCSTWGMLTMFFYFLGYNYATCLAIEVIIKLKNWANLSHKRRIYAYHLVSISISLVFCIIIYVFKGYGVSGLNTCSVNAQNNIHLLEFAPFAMNIPIIWYSVIYAFANVENKYKSVTINYVLIVTSVSITWFFPTFFKLMVIVTGKDGNWTFIAFIIGTTSGLFVGLSRLLNKKVIKEIKKVISNRELKKINPRKAKVERNPQVLKLLEELNSMSEDYDFFTNFFELIGQNVIIIKKITLIFLALIIKTKKDRISEENQEEIEKITKFSEDDFVNVSFLKNQENLQNLQTKEFGLKVYKYKQFYEIQNLSKVTTDEIYYSFADIENFRKIKEMDSIRGGKSEAMLFCTNDCKFVMKTINQSEKKVLCKNLLEKYIKRLKECEESKLVRIYGVYKLLPEKQYFIVMDNIIQDPYNSLIFDLKGSYDGRFVEVSLDLPLGITLKDENFRASDKRIRLTQKNYKKVIDILEQDMKILMDSNIMDYSILTIFYETGQKLENLNIRYVIKNDEEIFAVGIIDILQKYNQLKKSERALKQVMMRRTLRISSIPANMYYNRICAFLKEIFSSGYENHLS